MNCAPSRKDVGSIPDGVLGFFIDLKLPAVLALESTQSPGGKDGLCVGLTIFPPSFADFLKILGASASWSLKGLSRPVLG